MGQNWPVQTPGNFRIGVSGTPSTLTATYSNTFEVESAGMDQLTLLISYIPKTGQSNRFITFKVDGGSATGETFQEIIGTNSGGLVTMAQKSYKFVGATGGTTYDIKSDHDISEQFVTVSVKEDGSSNFGTISVQTILSGK